MYLLVSFACLLIEWHIPPLIPFLTNNNISISANTSYSTLVFLKSTGHANSGAEKGIAGCSS